MRSRTATQSRTFIFPSILSTEGQLNALSPLSSLRQRRNGLLSLSQTAAFEIIDPLERNRAVPNDQNMTRAIRAEDVYLSVEQKRSASIFRAD
jgi:hypothetical protein